MVLMNFLRKVLLVLLTPLFLVLLFTTAMDVGVVDTVSDPSNVKKILADSGVYGTAVNSLLDQAKKTTHDGSGVDLQNALVRSAANATFTPQYVQQNTEKVVDSVYDWLDGKTSEPQFKIDLRPLKSQFAADVAQAVKSRSASLPACKSAASASKALADPVTAPCLPAGVSAAKAGRQAAATILNGKGFLDNTTIDANSVKSNNFSIEPSPANRASVFDDQLKSLPQQYQKAKRSPLILGVTTILVGLAIFFLRASRRKALRHLGPTLLLVGLFMLAFAWGLNYGVAQKAIPKIKLNNAVVQADVRKVALDVEQKVDQNYWLFGGVYGALGVLAIGASMYWDGKPGRSPIDDDLEGEGKTPEDRIDLKEDDKATILAGDRPEGQPAKPAGKKSVKVQ